MNKKKLFIMHLEERIVYDGAVLAHVIYVNAHAAAGGNGTSWAHAFNNLQSALEVAAKTPGEQIWLAEGTYTPSQVYSPLNANGTPVPGGAIGLSSAPTLSNLYTFDIPTDTSIYGGFLPGMTSLKQRNPLLYPTILSGDIDNNDINNPSNPDYTSSKLDNAWHVVTIGDDVTLQGASVTLDGLSIIDGYANGLGNVFFTPITYNWNAGGALFANFDSNVTINDLTFTDNYAAGDGGAVFTNNSDVLISNSLFKDNNSLVRAGAYEGFNTFETSPHTETILNDTFIDNSTQVFGGAVIGEGTLPDASSSFNVINCTFLDNTAPEGGAITIDSLTVNVKNSTFIDNTALVDGGAIATTNVVDTIASEPNPPPFYTTTVTDSLFIGNVAIDNPVAHEQLNNFSPGLTLDFAGGGGALSTYMNGRQVVEGNTFINNSTTLGDGGAIINGDSEAPGIALGVQTTITNNLFIGNSAPNGDGGAISSSSLGGLVPTPSLDSTVVTVKNNILLDNSAMNGGGMSLEDSTATVSGNLLWLNKASDSGDDIYTDNSYVNGLLSSESSNLSGLLNSLLSQNLILGLSAEEIYIS
jgi:predicted outer membrane repeat protein